METWLEAYLEENLAHCKLTVSLSRKLLILNTIPGPALSKNLFMKSSRNDVK